MSTPTRHMPMSPAQPQSGNRISLSLSDLVSPGLKEFDELETERGTSVSGTDATNYKKELKKLLAKSRGTAYESTLRRFVEQKYNEIKKDEASNRKLFGHSRGAIAGSIPSIASLSQSKYDAPNTVVSPKESSVYGVSSTYQDGRIVETNFDTLGSRPNSPKPPPFTSNTASRVAFAPANSNSASKTNNTTSKSALTPSKALFGHSSSLGYSILNERVDLNVTYNNKSRIDEISKPVERNVYKGPAQASPFASTNHLGRQRPPPAVTTKDRHSSPSPGRRNPSSSPYASPYRQRKAAEEAQLVEKGVSEAESSMSGAYPDLFQSLAQHAEILPNQGAKSYEEFRAWLANNRDWERNRTKKVKSIGAEVLKDTTHDFNPQILPKSKKLAERANQRTFQRLAASVAVASEATAAEQTYSHQEAPTGDAISENGLAFVLGKTTKVSLHRGHSRSPTGRNNKDRSRSRSPVSPQMRSAAPTPLPYPSETHHSGAGPRIESTASVDSYSGSTPQAAYLQQHHQQQHPVQRHSSLSTSTQSSYTHNTHHSAMSSSALKNTSQSQAHTQKARAGSAQAFRYTHNDDISVSSAPNVTSTSSGGQAGRLSSSQSVAAPSDVFERLAVRGRLKAHKTYNWDLPPPQNTYTPKISERSLRLAEKKHQRDLQVSQRARSASPAGPLHQVEGAEGPYLERNYDYYELYTMPERYMYRVAHPEPYKLSGTVPCNNIRHNEEKMQLEVSGLSKVTRARQERQRSASPAGTAATQQQQQPRGSVSSASRSVPQQSTPSGSILRTFSADHAMQMSDLGSVNMSSPQGLATSLVIRTEGGENYTFPTDSRGRNVSRSPKPRAHSPTFSPHRELDAKSVDPSRHVVNVVKEGIQQRKALSRSKREAEIQEFNRRHYLNKETKNAKPFQPQLLATETHRIMSRINSSFEDRTNKSVENIFVRREVAKRFPSPGPGRYTNGIAVEKIVQTLSVGSPQKLSRSRSMSPAPGHRGFSFGKEQLNRIDDPALTGGFSPVHGTSAMGNINNVGGTLRSGK